MKAKSVITAILLLFVAASVVHLIVSEFRQQADRDTLQPAEPPHSAGDTIANSDGTENKVIAYYFHGAVRCQTCRRIEAYAREALEAAFADELKSGKLVWRVVNVEEPSNKHFIRDYQLTTRSLVISDTRGGKQRAWKTLQRTWELVSNRPAFLEYVQTETRVYLEGNG